jgi:hypothetical protein
MEIVIEFSPNELVDQSTKETVVGLDYECWFCRVLEPLLDLFTNFQNG